MTNQDNEDWVKAVTEQLHLAQHTSNLFYTLSDALLAECQCQITGYSKVFSGNSGAEANEGAVKLARKYGRENKGERCNQIITLYNSFHGRTITALAATGQDSFHQHFFPFTEGFRYVPINDQKQLADAVDDTICGIMIDLVQGEGGVISMESRQVEKTKVDENVKNILYIIEGNEATDNNFLPEVMQEIVDTTTKYCGGVGEIFGGTIYRRCQYGNKGA